VAQSHKVRPLALELDGVLGDTRPLWHDWLADLRRRLRVEVENLPDDRAAAADELDRVAGNWRVLLERFAEERAPVYLRPSADVSAALRRLHGAGVALGAFTDAPEPLARVALAQLGARRRLVAVEAGAGALERLLARLGPDTQVVRTREELLEAVSA
jgi:phosphoglycolate phosphatase-like HAD superfamily hydrolase